METTKCLNEWNATIEALGQGKQTILIRKYNTTKHKQSNNKRQITKSRKIRKN